MKINPLHAIDFYKSSHKFQYPPGTTMVYSNLTPRSDRLSSIPRHLFDGHVVFFGLQHFIKSFLIDCWNREFFQKPKYDVVSAYKRRMDTSLGRDAIPTDHIEALHDLGHLPICIRALPEGSRVPIKVPVLVIYNTHPDFFWLTNYLETILSAEIWKPITSATVAYHYRKLLERYAFVTGADPDFVKFQGHDFSFRGMSGAADAAISGAAHLTSFVGTDTIPAIDLLEDYYNGNAEKELLGCSVPATEHSVMCMGGKEDEIGTFRRLITELYPKGIVSIVSDTWNFWRVVTDYVAALKPQILAREGKVVIRPDSGDPVKVICGDPAAPYGSPAHRGAVGCLWDVFGGSGTKEGYRLLDPHIGLIYGDSITLPRAEAILEGLKQKGFASSNIVFGIGSFTYQYATRDTFGFAVKSTYGEIDGVGQEIFKDPITDEGTKKSARGLLAVKHDGRGFYLEDRQQDFYPLGCHLEQVFRDGVLYFDDTIDLIRRRLYQPQKAHGEPVSEAEATA